MPFNSFTSSLGQKLQEIGSNVYQKTEELSNSLPANAQTYQRLVQEKLGHVTDISQMPQEYLYLEHKTDIMKLVFEQFLKITVIYENESYDYPKYVADSINDFSKTAADKAKELSKVSSISEGQNVLSTPGPQREPRTLNYALSKTALTSSEYLNQVTENSDTSVSAALLSYSDVQAQLAQARLQQDTAIQTKFNKQLRDKLAGSIAKSNKYRKEVQYKRLQYDVARTNLQNAKPEKEAALRVEMETLEDEFAQITEEATIVMQETLANANFLAHLQDLAQAQLAYYENSAKLMADFMPVLETMGHNPALEIDDPLTAEKETKNEKIKMDTKIDDDEN